MRLLTIALMLLIFSSCSKDIIQIPATKNYSNEIRFSRETKLVVENFNGNVDVKAVMNSESSTVSAVLKAVSTTPESAQDFLDKMDIKFKKQGDEIFVEAVVPKAWTFKGRAKKPSSWSADIIINIPNGLDVSCTLTNGNVSAVGQNARVTVQTINGNVNVVDNTDEISVVTTNGDTFVSNSQDFKSRVNQITTSGNCKLEMPKAQYGWFALRTTNGNIEMDLRSAVEPTVNLRTINGGIAVILGEKISGSLDLKTTNGEVSTDMIVNTSTTIGGVLNKQTIKGKFNVGRGSITAVSTNGNISLRYPDDSEAVTESNETPNGNQ
jgi:DUF4097 and DUF4098 domain-containing protein YvlB